MLAITTIQEAIITWKKFKEKYVISDHQKSIAASSRLLNSSEIDSYLNKINYNFSLFKSKSKSNKIMSLNDTAKIIQKNWYKHIETSLIQVNPKSKHSDEFLHLIHNEKIKKSLQPSKLKELKNALDTGDWDAAVFFDETLPYIYLAMSLFDSGAITQQQIYTILDRYQTLKDKYSYKHLNTYQILDCNGQLTKAALEILLPKISNLTDDFSEAQKESFRLLIAALPLSEQMFYTTSMGKFDPASNEKSLTRLLLKSKSLYCHNNELINLSAGAHDALGLTLYGLNEYVRSMPRLGKGSLDDIEEGVRHFARYTAMYYPDSDTYESVHEYKNITPKEATEHDRYHSQLMSKIPKNILRAFWRMVDISREATQLTWSKEIWNWIDIPSEYFVTSEDIVNNKNSKKYLKYEAIFLQESALPSCFEEFLSAFEVFVETRKELSPEEKNDLIYGALYMQEIRTENKFIPDYLTKTPDKLTSKELTDVLCQIISFGLGATEYTGNGFYLFLQNKDITLLGLVVLLDMLRNPGEWKKLNIDPQYLIENNSRKNISSLKLYLNRLNAIWPFIKNDPDMIQILKCHSYLKLQSDHTQASRIFALIDNEKTSILKQLGFEKVKSKTSKFVNGIMLTYGGEVLTKTKIQTLTENKFNTSSSNELAKLVTVVSTAKSPC